MNTGDFMRNVKKDVEAAVNKELQTKARKLQAVFDKVGKAARGKGRDAVEQLLRKELRGSGIDLQESDIAEAAEALASGQRVVADAKRFHLK